MEYVDTHCHLNEETFEHDIADVIDRAAQAGVTQMICIGTSLATSRRVVEIATMYPSVYAVVGIQPNYVSVADETDWAEIVELSRSPRVVGIGETGLDRYWDHSPMAIQQDYFRRHLALARERNLPFIVHCRDTEADVLEMLTREAETDPLRGVMHSFSSTAEFAAKFVALGMMISFSGMLSYKRNEFLREAAAAVPADRLLVETDAPYLAPNPHRGKRNEPAHVVLTAQVLAETRGWTKAETAAVTTANAQRFFALPATSTDEPVSPADGTP